MIPRCVSAKFNLSHTALVCEVWGRTDAEHDAPDVDSRGMGYHNQVYLIRTPNTETAVPWRPNSFHPQGVQMVMGDGSARFVPNEIDLIVFQATGTIAGSEVGVNF